MSDSDHPSVWRETFAVRSYEVDPHGRLRPSALLQLMQEAAGHSASSLGFSIERLFELGVTWVLARLRVTVAEWPRWQEPLVIETWPMGIEGVRAHRDFRFCDSDGRPIGRATSLWTVLDLASRRPTRCPPFLAAIPFPSRERELPGTLEALPRWTGGEPSRSFAVRWRDLDMNHHANNACYLEWALECVPRARLEEGPPSWIAVDFRAEARLGDEVVVETMHAAGADRRFDQRIVDGAGRELALVRTDW